MIKERLTSYISEFMTALLLIQPLLDVLSYFMMKSDRNAVTTAIRMVLLVVVCFYAFVVTNRKKQHLIMYMVLGAFWLIHMVNCFRTGYKDPVLDAGEYVKLIQVPLWTMAFITFFKRREGLNLAVTGLLTANFVIILLIIGLSFLVGQPQFTYDFPERGIQIGLLGWFAVPNTQSAIISILVPPMLLWALSKERFWLFCVACAGGFGLLYFTGTRFAFYAGIIIAAACIVLLFWNKKDYMYCIPLAAVIILMLVLQGFSPMADRRAMATDTHAVYQEKTDAVMGDDKDFVPVKGEEIPEDVYNKIKKVYTDIYGVKGIHDNVVLGDLIDAFGADAVMEKYNYSLDADVLYDGRIKKVKACELVFESKDFLTKLFGYEYADTYIGEGIYDPENDFPALVFYYGYIGTAIYILFILWFVAGGIRALVRGFPDFLSMEFGTAVIMFVLAFAAAQFSGQVLRKPSIGVYIAVSAAVIYSLVHKPEPRRRAGYRKKSVVVIKKI